MVRQRRRSPDEKLLLGVLMLAIGFVAAAALASAAVVVLTAASEAVEPPSVMIGRAPPDPTNRTGAVFTFTSPWATAVFECALDGDDFTRCTSPWAYDGLAPGRRAFQVRARDLAGGHGAPATHMWTIDITPPALAVPSDTVVEATGSAGAAVQYPPPSASDPSGIASGPSCAPAPGSTFRLGTTVVECTAADLAGNMATGEFAVTIVDTRPPALSGLPADTLVEATGPGGAAVAWPAPAATDLVSGSVPVGCEPGSGSLFPLGRSLVYCAATDRAGNAAVDSFLVVVRDTSPPTLTVPATPVRVAADRQGGALVHYTVTATDLVDGALAPACRPPSGQVFRLGTTTVSCEARDAAANVARASFSVIVFDETPPVITAQVSGTLGNAGWYTSPVTVAWSVRDPESAIAATSGCEPRTLSTDTSGATFTCRATSAGGTASESVRIQIDRTAPGPTTAEPDTLIGSFGLRSQDAGSGVAAIHYQLVAPGEQPVDHRWERYTQPFNACDRAIWAYAEDRAGNRQRPARIMDTVVCIF